MNRLSNIVFVCFLCLMGFFANLSADNIGDRFKSGSTKVSINDAYLQKWEEEHPFKEELNKHIYKIDSFSRLKEGQTQFEYYLLDEPITNQVYKTCLIYEYYESEMAVWIVNYSSQNKVIDCLEIFYDNAEGAWQTTATLDKEAGIIALEEYDAYADPEMKTEEYRILSSGKIEKIN